MEGFALSVLHTGSLPVHRTLAVILAATIGLQGCIFSPGQHLDTSDLAHQGPPDSPRFELVPITPRLVATQNAARIVETLPAELTSYTPGPYVIGVGDVL